MPAGCSAEHVPQGRVYKSLEIQMGSCQNYGPFLALQIGVVQDFDHVSQLAVRSVPTSVKKGAAGFGGLAEH